MPGVVPAVVALVTVCTGVFPDDVHAAPVRPEKPPV